MYYVSDERRKKRKEKKRKKRKEKKRVAVGERALSLSL